MLPFRKGEQFGYLDLQGQEVITPQFSSAGDFCEEVAFITAGSRSGYINQTGTFLFSLDRFEDAAADFSEGLLWVRDGETGLFGYLDRNGAYAIAPQFDDARSFSNGLACVMIIDNHYDEKWGLINRQGEIIIDIKYDEIYDVKSYPIPVRAGANWHYLDDQGQVVITLATERAEPFSQGLARVGSKAKEGFIDGTGAWVIEPKFRQAWDFHQGLAAVCLEGAWGFINTTGEFVIKPKHGDIGQAYDEREGVRFFEGRVAFLARVGKQVKWGYLDRKGIPLIEPQFSWAYEFTDGVAQVELEGEWGLIDRTGDYIIQPSFERMERIYNKKIIRVELNELMGYLNTAGKYIWRPS